MLRKPLNKKLDSFESSLLQFELSDREAEALQGGAIQPVGDLQSVLPSVKALVLLFANPFSA